MAKGHVFLILIFFSTLAFSQELPQENVQPLDSVVVDSLEVAEA
jgi:hypothetical protein